ncbi:MAG: ATP-binding cassette domain-containing protein [Clostridia bacterium]
MKAVELKAVSFSYDENIEVFDNADFYAEFGEVTLVAGQSGEGKSTLLSIISGIIPNVTEGKLQGQVLIDGASIRGMRLGDICRRVGVVLQNADEQIVHKLVGDEIAFGCENLAFPPEKIKRQIDIVCRLLKLDPIWKTRTLSGGQKQRLITASTLAMGQRVIILDEPLANLDSEGAAELMNTLRTLAYSGYAVIVVEHRLDVVLPYMDRVWHIGEKKISLVQDKYLYLQQQSTVINDFCPPFSGDETLLDLDGVGFKIKDTEILKDVSCKILKGARTVLIGENGGGKTTLLRLIARLNKPTSGNITQYIDSRFKKNYKGNKAWYNKVGVVYQNPDYQLFMQTVKDEIAFGAESPEYAKRIIELFGLTAIAERHPHSLSQGQKRRVSIAAVAACKPELLLLDEPTVGQDYEGLCELVHILNALHKESGNTMITITHDMRAAEALADKAILLKDGTIKAEGGKALVRRYFSLRPILKGRRRCANRRMQHRKSYINSARMAKGYKAKRKIIKYKISK